jgi:hypothetical protein
MHLKLVKVENLMSQGSEGLAVGKFYVLFLFNLTNIGRIIGVPGRLSAMIFILKVSSGILDTK